MSILLNRISGLVDEHREEAISFLQEVIRVPSPSGQEAEVARIIADKMRTIGYRNVKIDRLNDVMGTMNGFGNGRSLLFNCHIDHVPAGNMVDPYSGKLMDGQALGVVGDIVYGRAASDMKGAVAAMIMAGAILSELDIKLKGDFKIAAVAHEETGGAGTKSTIQEENFLGDVVIIGEATNMNVYLGHRGGARTDVIVKGRSCHASAPDRGVNAIYMAADLIDRIRSELVPRLPDHPLFGRTTLTVTKMDVKPNVQNVVPEECRFHIDCRNTPNYPPESLKSSIEEIIISLKEDDPDLEAFVIPRIVNGEERSFSGFYTYPDRHPVVEEVKQALLEVLGHEPECGTWRFATDGRFYSWLGIPVIGLGPGEEIFAHTNQDHIKINDYLDSIKAYAWLAIRICGVE